SVETYESAVTRNRRPPRANLGGRATFIKSIVGINARVFQKFPQPIPRLLFISIKRASAEPPELPAGSAQLGLTGLVTLPLFGSGPLVSDAPDGDAAVLSLHDQIYPVLKVSWKRAKLRDDGIAAVDDPFSDFKLELAVS